MKKYKTPKLSAIAVQEPVMAYGYQNFDDVGVFGLIDIAQKGISFKIFDGLSKKFPFTMQDWADFLHISGKTLSRYQKEDKSFDVLQSEKILQIEMLYKRGEEVFGSSDNFLIWLQSENVALGKTKPQDLLGSVFGISLLMDELTRIEHGVLA
ncbi:putative toxin-antitoxin system antitoxin component (TIGR02293 family) [Epilithonimonas hungarica]|uniref:type II RES/Xre toxin-antitoxin system antitoxin n=1 Tax=Epilithonimonas hungarica TaxID=454006 RepID=UPI0027871A15|nr:antitoxin Xre/MbcA/ParS toxin-binding domain-containing protein [Epilithonimonas hungarica]MDP9955598.1 putative toxin-antitoxin system antitoxin component (TIGR02293 family) [Epilithonimonas hungarica]